MNSLRKWFYKPKKTDSTLLAQFYFADDDLNVVAAELDSFDGRKDPERCTMLVNQLRVCQDKVLTVIQKLMDEAIPGQRANRDFRVKFPDDVLQDSLAGQLWFGAECLAAGSSILNREVESASMRPLARALTKNLDSLRSVLRDQCLRSCTEYTERIKEALVIFDKLFAEFELSYVSAMVPVKTMKEYDLLQEVTVLFSETVHRALKESLLTQDMIDYCDPALMFTIPRLAIVCGLLIYPEGPLNPDMEPTNISEMYRPFQTLLQKIRELLYTLSPNELAMLEKALCSSVEPEVSTPSAVGSQSDALLQIDQGFHEGGEGIIPLDSIGSNILVHSPSSGSPVTPVNLNPEVIDFGQLSPTSTIVNELSESELEDGCLNKSESQDSGLQSEIVSTSDTVPSGGPPVVSHDVDGTTHCTNSHTEGATHTVVESETEIHTGETIVDKSETSENTSKQIQGDSICDKTDSCENTELNLDGIPISNQSCVKSCHIEDGSEVRHLCREIIEELVINAVHYSDGACDIRTDQSELVTGDSVTDDKSKHVTGDSVTDDKSELATDDSVTDHKSELVTGDSVTDDKSELVTGDSVTDSKSELTTGNSVTDEKSKLVTGDSVTDNKSELETGDSVTDDKSKLVTGDSVTNDVTEVSDQEDMKENDGALSNSEGPGVSRQFSWQYNVQFALPQLSLTDHDTADRQSSGSFSSDSTVSEEAGQHASVSDFVIETLAHMNKTSESAQSGRTDQTVTSTCVSSQRSSSSKDFHQTPSNSHASSTSRKPRKRDRSHQSGLTKAPATTEHQSTLDRPNTCAHKQKLGKRDSVENISCGIGAYAQTSVENGVVGTKAESKAVQTVKNAETASCSSGQSSASSDCECDTQCSCMESETSSYNSETNDEEEIALAIQAAEIASRNEARSRFRSSSDLIHRLFVCIAGVADQLQTNYASDLRHILKCVFEMNTDSLPEPDNDVEQPDTSDEAQTQPNDQNDGQQLPSNQTESQSPPSDETQSSTNQSPVNHPPSQSGNRVPSSPRRIFDEPPEWVPDEEVERCTACKTPFTFVRRRHHCRNCGKIFCGKCSSTTVPLPQYGHQKPVRVCHRCFLYQVSHFTVTRDY